MQAKDAAASLAWLGYRTDRELELIEREKDIFTAGYQAARSVQAKPGDTVAALIDELSSTVERIRYNCDCQVGGVDALSIDTDWLQDRLRRLDDAYRATIA